jgi:hypothetical protein
MLTEIFFWVTLCMEIEIELLNLTIKFCIRGECKIECLNIGKNYILYKSIQDILK